MHIESVTDTEAIGACIGLLLGLFLAWRFLPGQRGVAPPRRRFTEAEITAYDRSLPKYVLVSAVALTLGGIQTFIKDLPPVYDWLGEAGRAGHYVRDLSNSHLVIVLGGTVIASALAWYALPRLLRRPLYSKPLADWSFWCTTLGAFGFYLVLIVTGLIMGDQMRKGVSYNDAKSALGLARAIPLGMTATVMGIGYWTFVANVLLTMRGLREVADPSPRRHLAWFFVIGAVGLLIGTVQGVIQVMPVSEDWIHAAGPAGEFIDPISHAHVNLVTGTLSLVAGALFMLSARPLARLPRARWRELLVFRVMVPGSLLFYLAFLILGLTEGSQVVAGASWQSVVASFGLAHTLPLMIGGITMFMGVALLLVTLGERFLTGRGKAFPSRPLIALMIGTLSVGITQGLLQVLPPVKSWLVAAGAGGDMVANAHAQLNMIGGAVPGLLAAVIIASPVLLLRERVERRRVVELALTVGAGIVIYYVSAMATALAVGTSIAGGLTEGQAVDRLAPVGPLGMSLGGVFLALGWGRFAWYVFAGIRPRLASDLATFRAGLARYDKSGESWRRRLPVRYYLLAEIGGGLVGWPGLGWTLSGRPLLGVPMLLFGPAIAWAVLPVLESLDGSGMLVMLTLPWVIGTTLLSTTGLAVTIYRSRKRARQEAAVPATTAGALGGARLR